MRFASLIVLLEVCLYAPTSPTNSSLTRSQAMSQIPDLIPQLHYNCTAMTALQCLRDLLLSILQCWHCNLAQHDWHCNADTAVLILQRWHCNIGTINIDSEKIGTAVQQNWICNVGTAMLVHVLTTLTL